MCEGAGSVKKVSCGSQSKWKPIVLWLMNKGALSDCGQHPPQTTTKGGGEEQRELMKYGKPLDEIQTSPRSRIGHAGGVGVA